MSDQEFVSGKIYPTGMTLEQFLDVATHLKRMHNNVRDHMRICECDTFEDLFEHHFGLSAKYTHINGMVYKTEIERGNDPHFVFMTKNEDGSITVSASYYNGGTCLQEILEEGVPYAEDEGSYRE